MRDTREDDEVHDLAAAYALGAVDDSERVAFEAHLPQCERCREEVASYDDAVLGLALSAPPVAPTPALRESLLTQVGHTPQQGERAERSARLRPAGLRSVPDPAPDPGPAPETPAAPGATPLRRATRRGARDARPRFERSRLLVAAAVVAVLAVGGVVVAQRPWQQPTSVSALDPVDQVRQAGDARRFDGAVGNGRVIVTVSPSLGRAVVTTQGLTALPAGRTYQGWFLDGSAPRPAGLLRSGGTQVLQGRPGVAFALSVEPLAGSAAPTTTPLVAIPLTT